MQFLEWWLYILMWMSEEEMTYFVCMICNLPLPSESVWAWGYTNPFHRTLCRWWCCLVQKDPLWAGTQFHYLCFTFPSTLLSSLLTPDYTSVCPFPHHSHPSPHVCTTFVQSIDFMANQLWANMQTISMFHRTAWGSYFHYPNLWGVIQVETMHWHFGQLSCFTVPLTSRTIQFIKWDCPTCKWDTLTYMWDCPTYKWDCPTYKWNCSTYKWDCPTY